MLSKLKIVFKLQKMKRGRYHIQYNVTYIMTDCIIAGTRCHVPDCSKMAARDVAALCSHLRCPQGISVSDALPEGRGLLSTQKWSSGSEIMEVRPLCHVVSAKCHEQLCANCFIVLKR